MPACPQCAQLLNRVTELEALVRDHEERLNQNSSNSSIPPSANPLGAPKPVVRVPSGRSPGGQKGHPGHHRHRLPSERVNKEEADLFFLLSYLSSKVRNENSVVS